MTNCDEGAGPLSSPRVLPATRGAIPSENTRSLDCLRTFPCKTLRGCLPRFRLQRRGGQLRGLSPGDTTQQCQDWLLATCEKSLSARRLRHSPQACRERHRFVASRCFNASDEATMGSSSSVRLYRVCVRNGEPVISTPLRSDFFVAGTPRKPLIVLPRRYECGAPPVLGAQ